DAIRAIKLLSAVMANAIQEGKQGKDEAPAAEAVAAE
ncbi:MAG: 30S ribosomal protein S2, partial [Lawsonibacter sp.]